MEHHISALKCSSLNTATHCVIQHSSSYVHRFVCGGAQRDARSAHCCHGTTRAKRTSRSLTFLVTRAHLHIRVIRLSFLQRDNGMSTANSVVEPAAPPLDASSKHTRACRRCGLVKTFDQVNSHLIDAVSSVSF